MTKAKEDLTSLEIKQIMAIYDHFRYDSYATAKYCDVSIKTVETLYKENKDGKTYKQRLAENKLRKPLKRGERGEVIEHA